MGCGAGGMAGGWGRGSGGDQDGGRRPVRGWGAAATGIQPTTKGQIKSPFPLRWGKDKFLKGNGSFLKVKGKGSALTGGQGMKQRCWKAGWAELCEGAAAPGWTHVQKTKPWNKILTDSPAKAAAAPVL